jgi:predicted neuraminidase
MPAGTIGRRAFLAGAFAACAVSRLRTCRALGQPADAVLVREYLYERAPFPSCHASTIVAVDGGLVAAWFGGTDEGEPDVGIWLSRHDGQRWSEPREVAVGRTASGKRYPSWNPVLFATGSRELTLWYKVGPSPREWWGVVKHSNDGGQSWSAAQNLSDGFLGPVRNKPVRLCDGTILCGSSTEHDGWRVHLERLDTCGRWHKTVPLNDGRALGLIQPTILTHPAGELQILCRSQQGRVAESWSSDAGQTWTPPTLTALPNPNSGIDAVTLCDGRHLLVYNHTARGRSPLNVGLSGDGKDWQMLLALETEPGEYSYPAVIEAPDGRVHVTYTWNRKKIRHVVIDPTRLQLSAAAVGRP